MLLHQGHTCLLRSRFLGGQVQAPKISLPASRPVAHRSHAARAAVEAPPANLRTAGSEASSAKLLLKVAPPRSAKGLVHRYLMYVRANARQVRHRTAQTQHIQPTHRRLTRETEQLLAVTGHLKHFDAR